MKLHSDGSIDQYKAKLVVLGNKQEFGVDYQETFALVAKMTIVRTILAIATSESWQMHHMNVKNSFLHVDLQEEIYIKLPTGMPSPLSNVVCKLKHSLYGLFEKFRTTLLGFIIHTKELKRYCDTPYLFGQYRGFQIRSSDYHYNQEIVAFNFPHERRWPSHILLGIRSTRST